MYQGGYTNRLTLAGLVPLEHRAAAQLGAEPADRFVVLALGRAVQLHEAQEQVLVRDALQHLGDRVLVEPAGSAEAAPEAVGAVVLLDRRQQALVVDVALREAAGS